MAARRSMVEWNLRSCQPRDASEGGPANLQLAGLPKSELKELISNCPPPNVETLEGHWAGVNRSLGLALTGSTQFIKRFETCRTDECVVGRGTNLMVDQVPADQLRWQGWQPRIDSSNGTPITRGNFLIVARNGLELDYTMAENRFFDPAKFLVDDLVQVDEGLLLGRAYIQFFCWRIPVAYFALSKCD